MLTFETERALVGTGRASSLGRDPASRHDARPAEAAS